MVATMMMIMYCVGFMRVMMERPIDKEELDGGLINRVIHLVPYALDRFGWLASVGHEVSDSSCYVVMRLLI